MKCQSNTWLSACQKLLHFITCLLLGGLLLSVKDIEAGSSFVKEIQPTKSLKEFLQQFRKEIPPRYAHSALRQRGFSLGGQVRGAGRNWGILKRSTFSRRTSTLKKLYQYFSPVGCNHLPPLGHHISWHRQDTDSCLTILGNRVHVPHTAS